VSLPTPLLPTFYLPEEDGVVPVTDSTPLVRRFEAAVEARSVIPPDRALTDLFWTRRSDDVVSAKGG